MLYLLPNDIENVYAGSFMTKRTFKKTPKYALYYVLDTENTLDVLETSGLSTDIEGDA